MIKRANGSSYIDENFATSQVSHNQRHPFLGLIAGVFAMLAVVLALQPFASSVLTQKQSNLINTAEAGSPEIGCIYTTGLGMDRKDGWRNTVVGGYVQPDSSGRTWTMQEALGGGLGFVAYEGEGEAKDAPWTKSKKKPEVADGILKTFDGGNASFDTYYQKNAEKLEKTRSAWSNCFMQALPWVADGLMSLSGLVTNVAQFIAVSAFNPNIICPDPAHPNGSCLNLLKVIGGTGRSDGGIIGALTSSIYYPLLVIVVTVAGFWVAYLGLVKRKFREALFGALWITLSVIFGLALLLNPALLAKAPMAVSNAVSTCVIGAFNGQNCMGGSSTQIDYNEGESTSDKICMSAASGATLDEQMSLTANSITCSIWKAFVLEPYTQASFGASFADLDTKASDSPFRAKLKETDLNPDMYCVSLGSSGSVNDQGNTLSLDAPNKNRVCNLMAYQMYLSVNAQSDGDPNFTTNDFDPRWYRVIMASAADEGLWTHWSNDLSSGIGKINVAGMSFIVSVLGTFIIFVVSLFALIYYISSLILLSFGALFFLLGVHPGRGKRILFGWLEKVIAAVLKYLASAVFLVVAIAIYGGILGNLSNMGLTLLFVVIVTMALFMYRRELMNLVGRVNMGGEQLSSSMADKLRSRAENMGSFGKNLALAGAGGAIGGMVATGANPFQKGGWGELRRASISGLKDGAKRQLKRSSGLVGNIARQYDRNTVDNKQDMRAKMQDAAAAETTAATTRDERETDLRDAQDTLASFDEQADDKNQRLQQVEENYRGVRNMEHQILDDFREKTHADRVAQLRDIRNGNFSEEEKTERISAVNDAYDEAQDFAQLQDLKNLLSDSKLQLNIAINSGDMGKAAILQDQIDQYSDRARRLASGISTDRLANYQNEYDSILAKEIDAAGMDKLDASALNELQELRTFDATQAADRRRLEQEIVHAGEALNDAERAHAEAAIKSKAYGDAFINMRPGDGLTDRGVQRVEEQINREMIAQNLETKQEQKARLGRKDDDREVFNPTQVVVPDAPTKSDFVAGESERAARTNTSNRRNAYEAQRKNSLRDRGMTPRPPAPRDEDIPPVDYPEEDSFFEQHVDEIPLPPVDTTSSTPTTSRTPQTNGARPPHAPNKDEQAAKARRIREAIVQREAAKAEQLEQSRRNETPRREAGNMGLNEAQKLYAESERLKREVAQLEAKQSDLSGKALRALQAEIRGRRRKAAELYQRASKLDDSK